MKKTDFIKLLESSDPRRIIGKYTHSLINLTSKQLDIVLDLKNDRITLNEVLKNKKRRKKING